jgi:large subunit ribosomal protein L6
MSRIGKKTIAVPAGVAATIAGQLVSVKGAKGTLEFTCPEEVNVSLADGAISVQPKAETKRHRAMWGMSRTMVSNLITGVTAGFEKKLDITGVGYRAAAQGKILNLALGFSHDINYAVPEGITIVTPKPTEIIITGINKQVVGQVAAEIRNYRGPEPYKGKGVRYHGEFIFRKEGKKK